MKSLVLICAVAVAFLTVQPQHAYANTEEARVQAAVEYEKLVPIKGLMNDMFAELKKNPAIKLSAEDLDVMRQSYDYDALRREYIQMMVKHFTLEEIQALNEFYSKPEGRSVMKKMPAYMSDFMPYIQRAAMGAAQEVLRKKQQQ